VRVTELLGYGRVSTNEQGLASQLDALVATDHGKWSIFTPVGSGAIRHRPQLERCFDHWRVGYTLAVWRADRQGRSLRQLSTWSPS
jgi:DNA invertase Pin-like site-specific DNA recombinase